MAQITYDVFVRELLDALSPVLPSGVSPELSFSGTMVDGLRPDPDSAVVGGRRAATFLMTATLASEVTGVSPNEYRVTRSLITDVPLVAHSAYARNLRRWESGTLPRKRRARSDLVIVATCWVVGWEDGRDAEADAMTMAWERLHALAESAPDDNADRAAVVASLWGLSSRAYRASLDARRGCR